MSESTYSLFQKGSAHLKGGRPAQATVSLEHFSEAIPRNRFLGRYGIL